MHWTFETPIPPEWTARAGRDAYLDENGFTVEAYDAPSAEVTVFGLHLNIPNPPSRKNGVRRHDLHHVVTGYGTDLIGEAEISAWEISRGLKGLGLYVRGIILGVAFIGLFLAPRRVWRAFRVAPGQGSLFTEPDYEGLLTQSVGQLRQRLGLPPAGLATLPRALHARAPQPARQLG